MDPCEAPSSYYFLNDNFYIAMQKNEDHQQHIRYVLGWGKGGGGKGGGGGGGGGGLEAGAKYLKVVVNPAVYYRYAVSN